MNVVSGGDVSVTTEGGIVTVTLTRGKVNALNPSLVGQLKEVFRCIERDDAVRAVVLIGQGKFFSFGFDIPEFLDYSQEDFEAYLSDFTDLYSRIFLFPKPVIAALNGHAIAGGCMIALACDYRLMVSGRAKISLNEITFGSSVFAGCVEMLEACVGHRVAHQILYSGAMYSAEQAYRLGLIDQIATSEDLRTDAEHVAKDLAGKDNKAFRSIKGLLRNRIGERMKLEEGDSIREFAEIWYSEQTWRNLQDIKIHS
jgi:enoyl-CoA hydratase/carnithine racemase